MVDKDRKQTQWPLVKDKSTNNFQSPENTSLSNQGENDASLSNSAPEHASHQKFVSKDDFESITFKKFLVSYYTGPWVLVKGGSIKGYFDWVPIHLRVGPWHPLATLYLLPLLYIVLTLRPDLDISTNHQVSQLDVANAFTWMWWITLALASWMTYILSIIHKRVGIEKVIITFTIQSWIINLSRLLLKVIAPFIVDYGLAVQIVTTLLRISRFISISTALIVFIVWNFVLMPLVACKFMKTNDERKAFLKYCFNFRMINVHILNLPIAIISSIISSPSMQKFSFVDLWYSLIYTTSYLLFYLFVLDRLGIHLYPILSPRSILSIFMWSLGLCLMYTSFEGCNSFVDYLSTSEVTKAWYAVFN